MARFTSGLFAAAVIAASFLSTAMPALADAPRVNQPAPDFTTTTFDGKELSLVDFRGQVLIINFWATWCGPCKTELPLLESYYRNVGKYGLRVLAVTTEDSLPIEDLKPLAAHATMDMARHFRGSYKPLGGVPTNYVIDRAGIVRYAKAAAFDLDDLNDIIIPLLREPPPPGLSR